MSILINTANALVNGKPQLESMLIGFKNASIPLNERWEAYTILVEGDILVSEKSYGDGYVNTLKPVGGSEYTLFDDFYVDRHQSITYPEMYVQLQDYIEDGDDMAPTPESLREWQEKVLASGTAGFKHDW